MINNKKLKKILLTSILASSIFSFQYSYASVRSQIQSLVKKYHLSNAKIGIAVERTKNSRELYAYAQDRELEPASNNKVFTMVAALFTLPTDFTFDTTINYVPSRVKNHILYGDMYIKFSGNPALTGGQLFNLIHWIKTQKHIKKINGNIYLVGVFSGPYIPEGWSKEDSTFCYGAPASSYTINRNCLVIDLKKIHGSTKTKVIGLSNESNINIINDSKYTSKNSYLTLSMNSRNTLQIKGYLSRMAERMFKIAIRNPALKTLDTVKDFLDKDNIKHNDVLIASYIPRGYKPQLSINSDKINSFVNITLKHSDNLYAETILNTVGLKYKGIGSTEAGIASVMNIINSKLHLNTDNGLIMYDGSGLSHYDRVSPRFMVNFLSKVYNSSIGEKFYRDLPQSGISGTIAYRMSSKNLLGKVHAKTGTLKGVSSLSGYVMTAKNHRVTFSIILNDLKDNQRTNARRFQDKVVAVFYKHL